MLMILTFWIATPHIIFIKNFINFYIISQGKVIVYNIKIDS